MKKILALLLTLVMIFSVVSCKNEEQKPEENTTAPQGNNTTPPTTDDTPNFDVEIPTASKLIAGIIGAISATLEVTDDTELVYVYESKDGSSESYTQVIFVEIAEATVNSDSETLQAQLTLKLGMARATGANAVVDKTNAEYGEISVTVDGEDISISVDGEKTTANLSEVLYGAVLNMIGLSDMAELETLLQNAYIAQELETRLLLIVEELITSAEIPTLTPEYSTHIQNLFNALGEDMVNQTTDAAGNVTYTLDLTALKTIVAEFENKTFAQYLTNVYGKTVADEFVSFVETLPEKKVKDIVDAAVTLAENADVNVKEIYALIDLLVESATGAKFDIEAQINDRYNKTLAELMVEISGIPAENQKEFIDTMKLSFKQVAEMLKTATIDDMLTAMFMGESGESFLDTVKAGIDMLNDMITFEYTEDAQGNLVALNYGIGEFQYTLEVQGNDTILNVTIPGGVEITATVGENGFEFAATQNGEQVASGSLTVTEESSAGDVITTVEADICDAENDLFDFTSVSVNGVVTELDVAIRGYDVIYEGSYNPETGEKFETERKTFVTFIEIAYDDLGNEGTALSFTSDDTVVTFTLNGEQLGVVVTEDGETLADIAFAVEVTTDGNAQVLTLSIDVDRIQVQNSEYANAYATFKGAIRFKIA